VADLISETVSKKRGRPKSISDGELALVRNFFPGNSPRHEHDLVYRQRAVSLLMDNPALAWLCNKEDMKAGVNSWKPTILAALGRLEESDMLVMAKALCDRKPRTKEAVAMIRRFRGKSSAGDALALHKTLVSTINAYIEVHPDISTADLVAAVITTLDMIRKR
jgi:hypothetical protein